MANQGKRMVKENLIAQIGQGGAEYTAGDNITIEDGVISATDTTYTAGVGIDIDANNEITANIKAGSGIVVDTDLTDDSLVVMVDDDLVQGKLTAGTGIDITTNTISVDNTIATTTYVDGAIEEVSDTLKIVYTESASDVLTELQVTDPEATNQDAVTEWTKRIPIILSRGSSTKATLQAAGYKNLIDTPANGTKLYLKGYFGFVSESSSSPYTLDHINYFITEGGSSASTNLFIKNPTPQFYGFMNSNTQLILNSCRASVNNTSMTSYTDALNRNINIVGFASNFWSIISLNAKSTFTTGIEMEGGYVIGQNVSAGANIASTLKAPTTDGTYTLKVTVTSGVPTFSWTSDNV